MTDAPPRAPGEMTLLEHLEELRSRLLKMAYGIVAGFGVSYYYSQQILDFFLAPLRKALPQGSTFQFTDVVEPFFVHLKLSLLAGFFAASPWVFYQAWKFVAPGLYPTERRLVLPFVLSSTLLFTVGAVFCFHNVFPVAFEYLVGAFAGPDLRAMPRLGEYFSFATKMLLAFGVVFELPLVCFFLGRLGMLTGRGMLGVWRYVIVGSFLVAGILTPGPDVASQALLAGPILLLYAISTVLVWFTGVEREEAKAG